MQSARLVRCALLCLLAAVCSATRRPSWLPSNHQVATRYQADAARTVYGHIHIAKTAGTSLNGMLAARYERVRGEKGYSFDAFQAATRFTTAAFGAGYTDANNATVWLPVNDTYSARNATFSRLRVPRDIMDEIGYEDCDWVSFEGYFEFWSRFARWPLPVELHVPCREPVDHLMSQCNFLGKTFECGEADVASAVASCAFGQERFNPTLAHISDNVRLRCYRSEHTFPHYVDYMAARLQEKAIPAPYIFRATNAARNRNAECVWSAPHEAARVREHLVANDDYYKFCDACLGSGDELELGKE